MSRSVVPVARAVVRETRARDVTLLAASIAYYAFVSLVPLLVLAVVGATAVGGAGLRAAVLDVAARYLLPVGRDVVDEALTNATGRGGVTLVGLVVLAWGSLKLFRGVDAAFARIYGEPTRDFLGQVRAALTVLVAVGAGTLGAVALVGLVAVTAHPLVALLGPVLLLGVLAVAFFPVYYLAPRVSHTPREALPGALFAAVGWTLLGTVFAVYAGVASTSGRFALYGVLGGMLLLVTWFYVAGVVLLVGAVLNAVLAGGLAETPAGPSTPGADRDRQVQHSPGRRDVTTPMTGTGDDRDDEPDPTGAPDVAALADRVEELRADLDAFEDDVEERTVEKPALEDELKRYVRRRMRRGHASGWGPYLVLLYGTAMTLGAFYFLDGPWAILAMVVLFLSTLGLYTLFVLVGLGLNLLGTPGRAVEKVREFRR